MLQAKIIGIKTLEGDTVPSVETLDAGAADHPGHNVQAVTADNRIGTYKQGNARYWIGGEHATCTVSPQLAVVASVHCQIYHVHFIFCVGQPVFLDSQ